MWPLQSCQPPGTHGHVPKQRWVRDSPGTWGELAKQHVGVVQLKTYREVKFYNKFCR